MTPEAYLQFWRDMMAWAVGLGVFIAGELLVITVLLAVRR
jgi:hypothetical protein